VVSGGGYFPPDLFDGIPILENRRRATHEEPGLSLFVRVFVPVGYGVIEVDKIPFFKIHRRLLAVKEPYPSLKNVEKLLAPVTQGVPAFGTGRKGHDFRLHPGFPGHVKENFFYGILAGGVSSEGVPFAPENGVELARHTLRHHGRKGHIKGVGQLAQDGKAGRYFPIFYLGQLAHRYGGRFRKLRQGQIPVQAYLSKVSANFGQGFQLPS